MQIKTLAVAGAPLATLTAVQASVTCDQLKSTSIQFWASWTSNYMQEQLNYWSTSCGELKPACLLTPKNAQEVSDIMKVLATNGEQFAVKSGGHNPNNYFASVAGGPLISTMKLNEVTYDKARNVVTVGPGNKWDDVMKALDGTNVTVVGGRMGNVGVGGYLLGGGLSFLSTQHGWAANSIVEAEVVLANGTIITASGTSNANVLSALKGGGNNFGIVTKFGLRAHPISSQIWGGNMMFSGGATDKVLAAVRDFTEHYDDPKAAIIATSELALLNALDIWTLFLFYDGPTPPAGIFDRFKDIGPTIDSTKTRTYADLLSFNNWAVLHGSRYVIATETTPLPSAADGPRVMRSYYDHWHATADKRKGELGLIASMALQPIPRSLIRAARRVGGGDLLDLDDAADRIMFEFNYSYLLGTSDGAIDDATVELMGGIKGLVDGYVKNGTLPDVYRPLFMNDAYHRQDYWGRLRPASRQLAVDVGKALDPQGVFAKRTGGLKM